jgi:hypothetical protein
MDFRGLNAGRISQRIGRPALTPHLDAEKFCNCGVSPSPERMTPRHSSSSSVLAGARSDRRPVESATDITPDGRDLEAANDCYRETSLTHAFCDERGFVRHPHVLRSRAAANNLPHSVTRSRALDVVNTLLKEKVPADCGPMFSDLWSNAQRSRAGFIRAAIVAAWRRAVATSYGGDAEAEVASKAGE